MDYRNIIQVWWFNHPYNWDAINLGLKNACFTDSKMLFMIIINWLLDIIVINCKKPKTVDTKYVYKKLNNQI